MDSFADFKSRCSSNMGDPANVEFLEYRRLAILAAENLGGDIADWEQGMRWLMLCATDTSEEGVMAEVNACIDML